MNAPRHDLRVELLTISRLRPYGRNPRTHSARQIKQIASSIKSFGFTNPILIGGDDEIIAGHGRLQALRLLGHRLAPVIRLENLSEAQKRAYLLADNKLAENAGWDRSLLAVELQSLLEIDLDFEIGALGFETGEIDSLLGELSDPPTADDAGAQEIDHAAPPVTQLGDLWALGRHRLLCADALDAQSYVHLLGEECAEAVFTDPPYNVRIDGHVVTKSDSPHKEFAMASGEMTSEEFETFLETALGNMAAFSNDGAIHFICMDWRHLPELLCSGQSVYTEMKSLCVWVKRNAGMGSLYRSQHELVAVYKVGTSPHINNVDLGRHGRRRTNVWVHSGMNSFGRDRDENLATHPTIKPTALVEDAILDCSNRNGIVLDPFAGSGTTLIAAERTGRRGFGMEIAPCYVDAALARFSKHFRIEPILVRTGESFSELRRHVERGHCTASGGPERESKVPVSAIEADDDK